MRQYAVLRNVVRDVNFGVVVKSDGNLKFFGWSEKAVEWANWANANNANLSQLPPNISVGEFKGMSDEVMKSIILSSEEATAAGSSTIRTKTIAFDAGGERYPNASKFPSFVDSPISGDWIAKNKSINFKAHNFRKEVVQNELALRVRMHELAFNNETKQFVAKPNRITATHTRSEIQKKMSRGAERKFGKKIVEYTNKEILKNYVTPTIKRDVMGKSTKDILDVYTKARLGETIGRAVGGAVRGATPNRRTRGVASRFISGVLDPRKRRDIDGDGMIFDGTWREMPDPNRFVQKPEKPRTYGMDPFINDELRRSRKPIDDAAEEIRRAMSSTSGRMRSPKPEPTKRGKRERTIVERGEQLGLRSSGRYFDLPDSDTLDAAQREIDSRGRISTTKYIDAEPRERGEDFGSPYREIDVEIEKTPDGKYRLNITSSEDYSIDGNFKEVWSDSAKFDELIGAITAWRNLEDDGTFGDDSPKIQRQREILDDIAEEKARLNSGRRSGLRSSGSYFDLPDSDTLDDAQREIDSRGRISTTLEIDGESPERGEDVGSPNREIDVEIEKTPNGKYKLSVTSSRSYSNDGNFKKIWDDSATFDELIGAITAWRNLEDDGTFDDDSPKIQRQREILDDIEEEKARLGSGRRSGLRSSGNVAEVGGDAGRYDDMPSIENAVAKLTSGDRVSADELDYLDEVTNRILDDPDTPENIRDSMLDLKNVISARRRTGSDSLRSSGGGGRQRGRMPKDLDSISKILQDYLGEDGYRQPWRPGVDSGAKTPVDDIPDLSDEAIRDEIEMIDNRPRVYDGNVTRPRMDRERKAALERELRRRARGGGRRKPTQKPQSQERRPARPGELMPLSTRRSMATTERAAKPRGTTLRSSGGGDGKTRTPAPKSTGRGTGAGPGGKAGHSRMTRTYGKDKKGDDGKVFESLTPEQQDAVKKALAEEVKPALDKKLKTFFSKYWNARTKRGSKKQSVVAVRRRAKGDERGRYEKVSEDTPLDSSDIYEMLYRLDGQVAEGLLEKFEVEDKDSRKLKLTEDGEAKISTAKNGYTVQQRALDDAQTILNMVETEDFSALEHLHPSTKKKIADVIKKNGGTVPKGWIDSESSIAGWAGGEGRTKAPDAIDLEKERGIGKKKKEKRLSLFQRLRRVDPERERRVELRAARRNRLVGRSGVVLDPKKELKRRKLRATAMKRSFVSKFKKQRNPEVLSDDLGERRNELHPVQIAPDGAVSLKPEFTKTIAALDVSFRDKNRSLSNDQLLGDLWENLGFSETPVLVTEDEVKSLITAGWQPIIRGTGHEEVESESYVEQFLTSDGRFIPGRGHRAYGVGEYFAYPGGNWDGYSGNPAVDRHSMLVLIPPSATIMTASQVAKEQSAMQEISKKVVDAMKVLGGREATSKMEAGELAAEIRKSAPDIEKGETRSAQIVSRLVERLEELDKLPKNDTTNAEKQEILDTFDYLSRVSKAGESGYFAPIIGVDAIDTNEGGDSRAPMLLHNRSIVAAFQRPMTRNEAEAMSGETRKVWTRWKRKPRIVDADGETQKPRARRRATGAKRSRSSRPDGDGTPDITNNQSPNSVKAVSTSGWKQSRPSSTGSNPATLLTAPDGTEYYAKLRKQSESIQEAKERMETEVLASELYKLAGIQAADLSMGDDSGEPQMLSRMIQARMPNSPADNDAARDGFVVDAWLANWDAPLNDNIKFDSNGNPVRLDVGGSLDYRAQGARKGQGGATAFGDTVGEITSMQKSGTYNFTNMDPKEIRRQAQKLSTVTDADIRSTVSRIVSDPQRAAKLAQTLINRRNDIVSNYG